MNDDTFIIRKEDAKECICYNNDDEIDGLLSVKKINVPRIISLAQIPHYSNFFITVHPFILTGYRIHYSLKDCINSIFSMHNETTNIWSHFLSLIGFILLILFNSCNDVSIVYLYIISTLICFSASIFFHVLNSHSED